jgi:ferredoxin
MLLVRRPWRDWLDGRLRVKVVVDFDVCASNAVCMGIVPEVFEVRDDGFLYVLDEHPPETLRDRLREAVRSCPTGAITLVEDG